MREAPSRDDEGDILPLAADALSRTRPANDPAQAVNVPETKVANGMVSRENVGRHNLFALVALVALADAFFPQNTNGAKHSMDDSVSAIATGNGPERIEALNAIYSSTSEAIPSLIEGLNDPNRLVRRRSIRLLREFGPQNAVTQILSLSERDPDWMVRGEAIMALSCISHPDVQALLKRLAMTKSIDATSRVMAMRAIAATERDAGISTLRDIAPKLIS